MPSSPGSRIITVNQYRCPASNLGNRLDLNSIDRTGSGLLIGLEIVACMASITCPSPRLESLVQPQLNSSSSVRIHRPQRVSSLVKNTY